MLDPGETCDDGAANGTPGDPCLTNCAYACNVDQDCSDAEPCNGVETCSDHACQPGVAPPEGTDCGSGSLCRNGACTPGVCGDMYVTSPEECDDGNEVEGDGCDNNCMFSCVSTDITRDCTPADACAGQGTCNDTTHECAAGTPLVYGTPCGSGGYCNHSATCTVAVCGNSIVEPGEDCDDGGLDGTVTDGCNTQCHFVCVNAMTDCAAAPYCEKNSCTTGHLCQPIADTSKNGMTCGTGLQCSNGACIAPTAVCGNGVLETGEQCDFGANNGPGTGCESNCTFSCTISPNSCSDGNPCNGVETCGAVTVAGHAGQKCSAGTNEADGTTCGTGKICLAHVCDTSTCGDGYVNSGTGETCDPPNATTCDPSCHTVVCGDGVRADQEECDDHNLTNLDGCSSTCKFEHEQRVDALSMAYTTDTYCTKNGLGGAFVGSVAQNAVASSLTSSIKDGSITIILAALGLDDDSATNDPSVSFGLLGGTQTTGMTAYNGASDLDWWYTTSASTINASRVPTTQLPGSIATKTITTTPVEAVISVSLAGVPAMLDMLGAHLRANVGGTSIPTKSTNNETPGHLPSENLDPTLATFASTSGGELCGNVTAASLAAVLAPSALVGCGFTSCTQCFTASNTVLDILISGCGSILGTQIRATQPDSSRSGTDTYTFAVNSSHVVTSCKKNGVAGTLSDCLANATYSAFLKFTTDRVISK